MSCVAAMETAPFGAVKPPMLPRPERVRGHAAMETAPFGAVKRWRLLRRNRPNQSGRNGDRSFRSGEAPCTTTAPTSSPTAAMETAPFGAVKPRPLPLTVPSQKSAAMETAPFGAVKSNLLSVQQISGPRSRNGDRSFRSGEAVVRNFAQFVVAPPQWRPLLSER